MNWIEDVLLALLSFLTWLVCMAGTRLLADGGPYEVKADAAVRAACLMSGPEFTF